MKKVIYFFVVIILFVAVFYKEILTSYYNLLVENDSLTKADAIFILGGGATKRTLAAVELYKNGYAKEILYAKTKDSSLKETKTKDYKEYILKKASVNSYQILHNHQKIATSTFDEAYEAILYAKKNRLKTMILVTDQFHSKRAKYTFVKIANKLKYKIDIMVYSIKKDFPFYDYDSKNWWENPYIFAYVMIAGMKFLIYIIYDNEPVFIKQS